MTGVVKLVLYELVFLTTTLLLYRVFRRYEPVKRVGIAYHALVLVLAFYIFVVAAPGLMPGTFGPESKLCSKQCKDIVLGVVIVMTVVVLLRLADTILIGHLLVRRMGVRISVLARHLTVAILVAGTIVLVLSLFGVEITPLLATSAIGTAIIGLALQDVLGNVIAGVALQAEQPFKVGDWVHIGDAMGRVVEMNWRATRLATMEGDHVILPNSTVARDKIRNYQEPVPAEARYLTVGVEYAAAPGEVKRVLAEAIDGADGVLKRPAPKVRLIKYGDFSITYEMKFWIDRFGEHPDIQDNVMTRVWYLFRRNRITIPFPIRNVFHHRPPETTPRPTLRPGSEEVMAILRGVTLFEPLSDEQLTDLSNRLEVGLYTTGEALVRQDQPGDSFFVIASGHVSVRVNDVEVARLNDRDYFGEMSLMTGQPRNATVVALIDTCVLIISRDCFHTVLEANPTIVERLTAALERINAERTKRQQEQGIAEAAGKAMPGRSLLRHVRHFFGLE